MIGTCRHCGLEAATRARGLGSNCYYDLAIRHLYPAACDSPQAFKACRTCGGPVASTAGAQARCSTCKRPRYQRKGYFERIAVYAERAQHEKPLFTEAA